MLLINWDKRFQWKTVIYNNELRFPKKRNYIVSLIPRSETQLNDAVGRG